MHRYTTAAAAAAAPLELKTERLARHRNGVHGKEGTSDRMRHVCTGTLVRFERTVRGRAATALPQACTRVAAASTVHALGRGANRPTRFRQLASSTSVP